MTTLNSYQLAQEFVDFLMTFHAATKRPSSLSEQVNAGSRSFNVLFTLKHHPNHDLTMSQLADDLQMPKQQLTKLVNSLEENGMVCRIHNPTNRRLVSVHITPSGTQLVDDSLKEVVQTIIPELEIFSEEEKTELHNSITTLNRLM